MEFSLENISAVVFDLDGTLYDKHHLALRLVGGERHYLPLIISERHARSMLRGRYFGSAEAFYDVFFTEMARGHVFTKSFARNWYFNHYMPLMTDILRQYYTVRPEIPEIIWHCRERSIPMAVYSDYDFVREKLSAIGLNPEDFALIVSSASLGGLKPSREPALAVIDMLGATPESTLFVGDRDDTDGETARAVGASFFDIARVENLNAALFEN